MRRLFPSPHLRNKRSPICGWLLFILGIAGMASCTLEDTPRIRQFKWQLNFVFNPTTNRSYETLSLFVQLANEKSLEKVHRVVFRKKGDSLFWELDRSNWKEVSLPKSQDPPLPLWIGSNALRMATFTPFPPGTYEIRIETLSGKEESERFFLAARDVSIDSFPFPTVKREEDLLSLQGAKDSYQLLRFDDQGTLREQTTLSPKDPPLPLVKREKERLYLYRFDVKLGVGVRIGPFSS